MAMQKVFGESNRQDNRIEIEEQLREFEENMAADLREWEFCE